MFSIFTLPGETQDAKTINKKQKREGYDNEKNSEFPSFLNFRFRTIPTIENSEISEGFFYLKFW